MSVKRFVRRVAIAPVRGYQIAISPLLGARCRFYPTCSHYAIEAIEHHGVIKGGYLTARRLIKCHPFHPGGYDPVSDSRQTPESLEPKIKEIEK